MTIDEPLDSLPPIQAQTDRKSFRQFQVKLPTNVFLQLEIDAARRGLTSYKLASSVLALYLGGKLVMKQENKPDGPAVSGNPSGEVPLS